ARRRAARCRRPLPDPAEDGAPHFERWRRGLPVSAATRGRCLRLQQGPGVTEATCMAPGRSRVKRTVSSAILCTALCRRSSFSSRVRDLETGLAVFLPIFPASLLHLHY